MLDIYPGRDVSKQNVSAIVNLVAGSIGDLQPENVTVVDQQGRQLSETHRENDQLELSDRQFNYRRRIEQGYEDRIAELISPIAGSGRVRVTVSADVDFSSEQESRESWNPDRQVVRSEQINEQVQTDSGAAKGVPGALSNQPPGAQEQQDDEEGAALGNRSVIRNYEIERVLAHSNNPSGRVKKLSVAVLVDNHRRMNEEGEMVVEPMSNPEIERMTLLVKDAVGFEQDRGDRVTVMAADFRDEALFDEEVVEPAIWEQAWFANLIKQLLIGIAVIVIVFAVLRPGMRSLLHSHRPQALEAGGVRGDVEGAVSGEYQQPPVAALGGPQGGGHSRPGFEQQLSDVRGMVEEDPRRVAQVVNKWVTEDNG